MRDRCRERPTLLPEAIALAIVAEDEALLVVDKPAGLVVHPGAGNWAGTLANALLHHAPQLAGVPRAGIVHRLDKDTSGLMVVAKTLAAHTALVRQLQARTVTREYLALAPATSRAATRSTRRSAAIRRVARRWPSSPRAKPARTHFDVLERFGNATLLRCRLETGRTHQIRVHLASLGHPLVGDPAYGRKGPIPFPRQALHAARLALVHPVTRPRRCRGSRRCRTTSRTLLASLRAQRAMRDRAAPASARRCDRATPGSTGSCPTGPLRTTSCALATTRNGGVSTASRASMNLGRSVGDDAVGARGKSAPARRSFCRRRRRGSHQVHGAGRRDAHRGVHRRTGAGRRRRRHARARRRLRGPHRRLPAGAVRRSARERRRHRARGLARACARRARSDDRGAERSRRPARRSRRLARSCDRSRRASKSAPMFAIRSAPTIATRTPGSRRTAPASGSPISMGSRACARPRRRATGERRRPLHVQRRDAVLLVSPRARHGTDGDPGVARDRLATRASGVPLPRSRRRIARSPSRNERDRAMRIMQARQRRRIRAARNSHPACPS